MQEEQTPLFSIIVPVFNGEQYLAQALDSIKAQTFNNFEVLVVDDGSVNGTHMQSVVEHMQDERFRYLRKNNGGVSTALNLGISHARGEYFCWLSHDDMWAITKLEKQAAFLDANTILCSNYKLIDSAGNFISQTNFHQSLDTSSGMNLITRGLIHGCSVVMPLAAIKALGGFDEGLKYTQDYDLWLRAIKRNYNFTFMPNQLVYARVHSLQTGKTSNTEIETQDLWLNIINYWISQLDESTKIASLYEILEKIKSFENFTSENGLTVPSQVLRDRYLSILGKISVSVIIPVKDRISLVKDSIRSISSQSHRNIEVIVVNDSSNFDLMGAAIEGVVKEFPQMDIKIINSLKGGVSNARNLGISISKGDFVAFLDSGDQFLPEKIEVQLYKMLQVDAVFSHTNYLQRSTKDIMMDTSINSGKNLLFSWTNDRRIATTTVMLNRAYIHQDLFNRGLNIGEDSDAWIKIILKYPEKTIHIDRTFALINVNANSSQFKVDEVAKIIERNTDAVLRHYSRKNQNILKIRALLMGIVFKIWLLTGRPAIIKNNQGLRKLFFRLRGF